MGTAHKNGKKQGSNTAGLTPPLRLSSGRIAPAPGRKRQPGCGKENTRMLC
jgi:hypothetical protein